MVNDGYWMGFHSHGGSPSSLDGFVNGKLPSINGWWGGYPHGNPDLMPWSSKKSTCARNCPRMFTCDWELPSISGRFRNMVLVCPRPEGHCQDEQGTVQRRDLLPRKWFSTWSRWGWVWERGLGVERLTTLVQAAIDLLMWDFSALRNRMEEIYSGISLEGLSWCILRFLCSILRFFGGYVNSYLNLDGDIIQILLPSLRRPWLFINGESPQMAQVSNC